VLRRGLRATCALVTAVVLALGVVPQPASAATRPLILGSGSTTTANMLNQWSADLDSRGMRVVYIANGSTSGRGDFANGSSDFAVSDVPYGGGADASERPYSYVPLVASGVAFAYNLQVGGERLRDLRLSGETLVRIFTGRITSWADPAIAADNDGRILPATPITPVARADDNGTTGVLTSYFTTQFPSLWRPCDGGSATATTSFPVHCGAPDGSDVAESGERAVIDRIVGPSGDGAIGYVETNSALMYDVPIATVENAAGYFVGPWGYNVSIGLDSANDPRAYPLSHYESAIVPTSASDPRMITAKRQVLVDFLSYAVCAGQAVAVPIGYGPLPRSLAAHALSQIALVAAGDGGVDLAGLDPSTCNTPDIDRIAPLPRACQERGAGPCGPPTPSRAPSMAGPVRVGATVKARMGTWKDADSLSLRWLADGAPIAGATGATYRVPAALLGRSLSVEVTGLGEDIYPSRTVTSAEVRVAPGRLSGSRLRIAGRPFVGRTLAVRGARLAGARVQVQWYAAGRKISGARSLRWTLRRAQLGERVTVRVVATAAAYDRLVRTSPRTKPIRRR
jgi:phosphate transport system substrate-binding protein